MDPVTLAAVVVAALSPFIAKAGEGLATKIGEETFEQGKRLYEAIHARFTKEADKGDDTAVDVLQNYERKPAVYSDTLQTVLVPLLENDPAFAQTLTQIVQSGPTQNMDFQDDANIEDTHMDNEYGKGSQNMKGGHRSHFKNVSMNIGPKKEHE